MQNNNKDGISHLIEKEIHSNNKILKPDYRYVDTQNPNERIHKFNLRKRTIHQKYNLPMSMRESEMVKKIGYSKIWDCGLYRYIWKNETV